MSSRLTPWVLSCALLLLSGCLTVVKAPAPTLPAATADDAQAAWARVLGGFVNDSGEVDFAALARDRSDLDRYVRYVADTPLGAAGDGDNDSDAKLAHMINAYNALSMFNVLDSGIPRTHAGLNKVTFFLLRRFEIGGQAMSLYSFENDVIRPYARQRNDPRVHFALNCSAVSCPVLPRSPFTGAALAAELQRETLAFFARPQNFRIDSASRTVWLNEILSFYTADFVPASAPGLLEYVNRYAPQAAPLDYAVRFAPYDWTVANSRRAHGQ